MAGRFQPILQPAADQAAYLPEIAIRISKSVTEWKGGFVFAPANGAIR